MLLLFLATLPVACLCGLDGDPPPIPATHFIVTNGALMADEDLVVHVNLLQFTSNDLSTESGICQVNVSLVLGDSLSHNETWTIEPGTKPEDYSRVIRARFDKESLMEVRSKFPGLLPLRIESSRTLNSNTFMYSVDLPLVLPEGSLIIQTDKETYQPGEKIMIRIFSPQSNWEVPDTSGHLDPLNFLNVTITDSQGVAVIISMPLLMDLGVVTQDYVIPKIAKEGPWTISVKTLTNTRNKTINVVRKGFQPFVVTMETPRYHAVGLKAETVNPNVNIRVQASKHSGLPIHGDVTLTISTRGFNHSTQLLGKLENGLTWFQLDLNSLKAEMNLPPGHTWLNQSIQVSAQVVDTLKPSSLVVKSASIDFTQHGFDWSRFELAPKFFKPSRKYFGAMALHEKVTLFDPAKDRSRDATIVVKSDTWTKSIPVRVNPGNGVTCFSVDTLETDTKLEIQASYFDEFAKETVVSKWLEISQFDEENLNKRFIQAILENDSPVIQSGENLKLLIETSFPTRRVFYEVFSQKLLVLAGSVNASQPTKMQHLEVQISKDQSRLLANSRVVVWTQDSIGTVVSDSLFFSVQGERKGVELNVNPESEAGKGIKIGIKSSPNSVVYLFATSTFTSFNEDEQEKDKQIALNRMKRYLTNSVMASDWTENLDSCSTFHSLNGDSMNVFVGSQATVFGNSYINIKSTSFFESVFINKNVLESYQVDFDPDFWDPLPVGREGTTDVTIPTDESHAVYTVSAVSVHHEHGLNVAEPVQVTVTAKVPYDVLYPERVTEGESFNMEVELFNRGSRRVESKIELNESYPIEILCQGEMMSGQKVFQTVQLDPSESKKIFFHVNATSATEPGFELETMKKLKIQDTSVVENKFHLFKGHTHLAKFMNIFKVRGQLNLRVKDQSTVSKTTLTIYDDLMAPAKEYVLNSLKRSNIVDELSNMKLAIISNTLESLFGWNSMDLSRMTETEEQLDLLLSGLQHLFNQQRVDGSFASTDFNHGPIKQTSAMLDAMLTWEAQGILENSRIIRAVEWLIEQQRDDGSFSDDDNDGDDDEDDDDDVEQKTQTLHLTCQVILSLIKSHGLMRGDNRRSSEDAIVKSFEHLYVQLMSGLADNDRYALSTISYAFMLLDNDHATHEAFVRRNKLKEIKTNKSPDEDLKQESLEIQSWSYDLLTHLAMAELKEALVAAKWLVERMGQDGRFVTAEATSVALKALSRYMKIYKIHRRGDDSSTSVELKFPDGKRQSFKVNGPNFAQSFVFDEKNNSMVDDVEINVEGEELLLFQLEIKHDQSYVAPSDGVFQLNQSMEEFNGGHQLKFCLDWLLDKPSGPVVVEIPVLSGYQPLLEGNKDMLLKSSAGFPYLDDGVVYMTLHEFKKGESRCLSLDFVEEFQVFNRKPKSIQAYSMFNLNKRSRLAYHDGHPKPENVCPLCQCDLQRRSKRAALPDPDVIIIIVN